MNKEHFNKTWDSIFDTPEYKQQQANATSIDEGTPRLNDIIAEATKSGKCLALTDWTEVDY